MKFKLTDLLAVLLVVVAIVFPKLKHESQPNTPAPSAELQAVLAPVKALLIGHPQAASIASFATAIADTLERDGGNVITTPTMLGEFNARAVSLRGGGRFQAVPGLADALNAALLKWIGSSADPLDAARRAKVVEFYRAIPWAAGK